VGCSCCSVRKTASPSAWLRCDAICTTCAPEGIGRVESERGEVVGGGTRSCCDGSETSSPRWGFVQRYPNVPPVTIKTSPNVAVRARMLVRRLAIDTTLIVSLRGTLCQYCVGASYGCRGRGSVTSG